MFFLFMHTALVCLTQLPVVHTPFSNKCLACHAYIKSCERTSQVKHFQQMFACHAYSILVPNTATSGAHTACSNKCLAFNAYTKSCRRTPPVMHTAFPANVSPCHALSTHAPKTVFSWAHSNFQQMFGLPYTHQVLQKDSSCHAQSIFANVFLSCIQH